MANIVIIMSVGSHQNATFGLAKKLKLHGHTVTYAGTEFGIYGENLKENVIRQNFAYIILDPYPKNTLRSTGISISKEREEFIGFAGTLLEGRIFKDFVGSTKPDLVLLDIHLPIYALCLFALSIDVVFLSTELATTRSSVRPPLTSSLIPSATAGKEEEIELAWEAERASNPMNPLLNWLLIELSNAIQFPLEKMLTEKCVTLFGLKYPELILWPEEFEFEPSRDKNSIYIGSNIDLSRTEIKSDFCDTASKGLIYFSIGTVPANPILIDFTNRLLSVSKLLPKYTFIFSLGRLSNNFEMTEVLPNVKIYNTVPQLTILKQAKLMLTLGGGNTIKECIELGVPMICFPFHGDQFGNAARIVHHGLGLRGDLWNESAEEIYSKIYKMILDPSFASRLKSFQSTISPHSENKLVGLIESYIK